MKKIKSLYMPMVMVLMLSGLLIASSGFKQMPIEKSASCYVTHTWTITNPSPTAIFAFGAVEDSFSDVTNTSFTSWGGSFGYQGGQIIFTVQFPNKHPGGLLTLKRDGVAVDSSTVVQNNPAIHLLVDPNPPVCNVTSYTLEFS